MAVGESASDRGAGQMDHRVNPGEQLGVRAVGVPPPLIVASSGSADQLDDAMSAGAQERNQRRTDQSRRSRDRHGRGAQTVLGRPRYQRKRPLETSPGAIFMPDGHVFGHIS